MGILQKLFSGSSANSVKVDASPEGFESVFGPRPNPNDFHDADNPSLAYRVAITSWNDAKKNFKGTADLPPDRSESEVQLAIDTYKAWGMGTPKFYEGRYGWFARFVESEIPDFEVRVEPTFFFVHNVIPSYQYRLIQMQKLDKGSHPWLPPDYR